MLNSSTPCTKVKVMVGHHKVVQEFILKLVCLYKCHNVIPDSGCMGYTAALDV